MQPGVAWPGDADLTVDREVIVSAVLRMGDTELWVNCVGCGGDQLFRVGHHAWHPVMESTYARLCDWRDRGVPLRCCVAAGRATSLIETPSVWLPIPNTRGGPRP